MTRDEARRLVVDAIGSVAPDIEVDVASCTDACRLHDDLGLDSIDVLEVVERVADRCGVRVPEGDFCVLATVGAFADYLAAACTSVTMASTSTRPSSITTR